MIKKGINVYKHFIRWSPITVGCTVFIGAIFFSVRAHTEATPVTSARPNSLK